MVYGIRESRVCSSLESMKLFLYEEFSREQWYFGEKRRRVGLDIFLYLLFLFGSDVNDIELKCDLSGVTIK